MFLENLEKLINENNLNKHSFSQQSGIPYKTIDNFWKKGYDNIKLSTLKKISIFFNVSLDFLIFGNTNNYIALSKSEIKVMQAYRQHPEMQPAINKMLDIEIDEKKDMDYDKEIRIAAETPVSVQPISDDEIHHS